MTHPPVPAPGAAHRPIQVGERAARALVSEFARDGGPKSGLLLDALAGSAALGAAIDALLAEDRLTVVADGPESARALRDHVALHGQWVAHRVTILEDLGEAQPADVVMFAQPLTGTAEEACDRLDALATLVSPGGVLCVVVPATTLPNGAVDEVERQAAAHGVGSDLVLRNIPPVRVHRLRYTSADPSLARRLSPQDRTSSVPLTQSMHIDSSGVAAAGIALGLTALAKASRPKSRLWLLPALAAVPVVAFFRDPQREVPSDDAAIVAASDGKVLSVEHLRDERFGEAELLRIAVFLSVLDVHVNRAPVAGKVIDHFVEDGGFAAAMKPEAEHNVASYTVLETARGTVIVAQRTGLIARRIVQRAPIGSLLAKGERFGLIRFGSRTDVYLPADRAAAVVSPEDRVTAGSTVIARWVAEDEG